MNNTIRKIIEDYKKFIDGHDEDWIYDETYEFFNDLSRSDSKDLMEFLLNLESSSKTK